MRTVETLESRIVFSCSAPPLPWDIEPAVGGVYGEFAAEAFVENLSGLDLNPIDHLGATVEFEESSHGWLPSVIAPSPPSEDSAAMQALRFERISSKSLEGVLSDLEVIPPTLWFSMQGSTTTAEALAKHDDAFGPDTTYSFVGNDGPIGNVLPFKEVDFVVRRFLSATTYEEAEESVDKLANWSMGQDPTFEEVSTEKRLFATIGLLEILDSDRFGVYLDLDMEILNVLRFIPLEGDSEELQSHGFLEKIESAIDRAIMRIPQWYTTVNDSDDRMKAISIARDSLIELLDSVHERQQELAPPQQAEAISRSPDGPVVGKGGTLYRSLAEANQSYKSETTPPIPHTPFPQENSVAGVGGQDEQQSAHAQATGSNRR